MDEEYFNQIRLKALEEGYKIRRLERNNLLNETDKYMIIDYPISEEEKNLIKIYRQQLRDIPKNNFEIPQKPEFIN